MYLEELLICGLLNMLETCYTFPVLLYSVFYFLAVGKKKKSSSDFFLFPGVLAILLDALLYEA